VQTRHATEPSGTFPSPVATTWTGSRTSSTPEELSSSTSANSPPAASKTTASRPRRFAQPTRTRREQSSASPHSHARGDADAREKVAQTLYEELDGEGGLPSLQGLQTKIVLDGHDDPVQFVLEHGTRNLPDGEGLLKIRDLLVDDGVTAVEGESDARTIVERTRRWAVAEWFVDEGLDKALLPQEYQPEPSTGFGVSRPELRSMLSKTERKGELANVYLDPDQRFWHDVLRSYDDPWELVDCPVDASLEHRLWDEWTQSFNAGEYEMCASQATQRHDRLASTYGDVPWTVVWEQAVDVATLAAELETWEESGDTSDVVDLYGDVEDGTWQIDNAVFNLIVSGEPEAGLPEEHPATATLDDLRSSLTESRYLEYLTDLGDLVVDQIEAGSPFVGEKHAHQFFLPRNRNISKAGRASRCSSSTHCASTSHTNSPTRSVASFPAARSR